MGTGNRFKWLLPAILVFSLTIPIVSSRQAAPPPGRTTPYDGQTLYEALFFGSGPVASKIPTLSKVAPHLSTEYKSLEGPVVRYIEQKYPSFFRNFEREIQSGDRVRVAAAIKNGNLITKEAFADVTKESNTKFATALRRQKDQPEPEPEADKDKVKDVATIVILYIPIIASDPQLQATSSKLKGLSFEQYVDEVVRSVPKSTKPAKPRISEPANVPRPESK
jgi:hypothetical protein